jgi:hypothetical protein
MEDRQTKLILIISGRRLQCHVVDSKDHTINKLTTITDQLSYSDEEHHLRFDPIMFRNRDLPLSRRPC